MEANEVKTQNDKTRTNQNDKYVLSEKEKEEIDLDDAELDAAAATYEARYGAEYRFFEILVNMVNAVNVVNVVNMVFGAFSSCFLFCLPTICW